MRDIAVIGCCLATVFGIIIYTNLTFQAYEDELEQLRQRIKVLEEDGIWC